jgi:hypothetical protein
MCTHAHIYTLKERNFKDFALGIMKAGKPKVHKVDHLAGDSVKSWKDSFL